MKRLQQQYILKDLRRKMVFLAGPRQAGKTWLAKEIAKTYQHPVYLNYDNAEHRKIIRKQAWLDNTDLLILDELHKMPRWKNYLKGLYDTKSESLHILVTGSARLDLYQKVGDSLAGRYFLHHLFPISLAELKQIGKPCNIDYLLERGGFPEPYLAESNVDAKRWRLQYIESLLRVDVLDYKSIENLQAMRMIFDLLRRKVGSPISYKSIAEDVQVAPNTVKKYIKILEDIYVIFRVSPYTKNIARSILKEPKIYFYDTGLVEGEEGVIFENLIANALFRHAFANIDYAGEPYQLKYLRTKDGREVDFALICNNEIESILEVKVNDKNISPHLSWMHEKYQLKAIQLLKNLNQEHKVKNIELRHAQKYLTELLL